MRIIDADILSYALYDDSPAHHHAWKVVEKGITKELQMHVTYVTVLEAYNVLFWFYKVRPLRALLEKLGLTVGALSVVDVSIRGLEISKNENIPLGDGLLIGAALTHRIPIIISNDAHITKKASKYGLLVENPIPLRLRRAMGAQLDKQRPAE